MVILGIDWGARYVGTAFVNTALGIPTPHKNFARHPWSAFSQELRKLCQERLVSQIIIGWPCDINGSPTQRTGMVSSAIDLLKRELNLPIIKQDERFSSNIAKIIVNNPKVRVDCYAAAQILNEYLRYGSI